MENFLDYAGQEAKSTIFMEAYLNTKKNAATQL